MNMISPETRKTLWRQKWWVLAFCTFIFILSDHAVIHNTDCYESPCFSHDTLVVQGMSFLSPTGLYSAGAMMPMNYADRYGEGIYFHGGWIYQAGVHAVVEDDLDLSIKQFVTPEDEHFFLVTTFIAHKFRVLFSFPLWIFIYWLLFIRLRKAIRRKAIYYPLMVLLFTAFILFGLLLKLDIGGGRNVTWNYVFNIPVKYPETI